MNDENNYDNNNDNKLILFNYGQFDKDEKNYKKEVEKFRERKIVLLELINDISRYHLDLTNKTEEEIVKLIKERIYRETDQRILNVSMNKVCYN